MSDLIKRIFNLFVETLWIKEIQKEERLLERAKDDVKRHEYVLKHLRIEFLKRYPLEVKDGN